MLQTKPNLLTRIFRSSEQAAIVDQRLESKPNKTVGLVVAIAKLLSSPELRVAFEQSPSHVAKELNVAKNDVDAFVALDSQQLNRQANTLLNKRWHEVQRLVPLTIESLGKGANEVFRYYATKDWPIGHRRHPVDAFRFLQFLIANQILEPNRMEFKRMRRLSAS